MIQMKTLYKTWDEVAELDNTSTIEEAFINIRSEVFRENAKIYALLYNDAIEKNRVLRYSELAKYNIFSDQEIRRIVEREFPLCG